MALTTAFEDSTEDNPTWTSYAEAEAFLQTITEQSPRVAINSVGTSVNGRPMQLTRIGYPAAPTDKELIDRATTLIIATQHGNEPAGREGALQFIKELAFTSDQVALDYLSKHPLLIFYHANPDKVNAGRANANGTDLNRDWMKQTQPETIAMSATVQKYRPVIISDFHQTNGGGVALRTLQPTNLEVNSKITEASINLKLGFNDAVNAAGFSTADYGGGGDGSGILRNNGGLSNNLSLLVEMANDENFITRKEQTAAAKTGMRAVIDYHRLNNNAILKAIGEASLETIAEGAAQAAISDPAVTSPPLGYRISATDLAIVQGHLNRRFLKVYEIDQSADSFIPMAQPEKKVLPFLVDAVFAGALVSAQPVMTAPPLIPSSPHYSVRISDILSGEIVRGLTNVNSTSAELYNLSAANDYQFEVQEQRADKLSVWSTPQSFSTASDTYNIEYRQVSLPAEVYLISDVTATDYLLEGLLPDETYEVRLQAANPQGVSSWTTWEQFTTAAAEITYDIEYRQLNDIGNEILVSGISAESYNLTGLITDTDYEFRVRSEKAGVNSNWTTWAQFTTISDTFNFIASETVNLIENNAYSKIGQFTSIENVSLENVANLVKSVQFSVNAPISLLEDATFLKVVEFFVTDSTSLTTFASVGDTLFFEFTVDDSVLLAEALDQIKEGHQEFSEELSITSDESFKKQSNFITIEEVAIDSVASAEKIGQCTLEENINLIFNVFSNIDILMPTMRFPTMDIGKIYQQFPDEMKIVIYQGSWIQLDFPVTINGETVINIKDAQFVIYLDNTVVETFNLSNFLSFDASTLSLTLDETFTETLEKPSYYFELWIADSQDNPFFVTKGELQIYPTKARF